jgi:transketolase
MIDQDSTIFNDLSLDSTRDGFGDAVYDLMSQRDDIVVVCGDLRESLRLGKVADDFPDRFVEVGVAEQNLIGVAAGLAKEGFKVFAASFAVFSPGRTHDQIRVNVCYPNRNVVVVGGHSGLSVGPDGATHQALEDVAMMRVLPNMKVVAPSDYVSAFELTKQLASLEGPAYLRLLRPKTYTQPVDQSYKVGSSQLVAENNIASNLDLIIIANGVMIDRAVQLKFDLWSLHQIKAQLANMHTIKPLDIGYLRRITAKKLPILVIEDHQVVGGLGSAIAEWVSQNESVPMKIIGVEDKFGCSGDAEQLLKKYGFSQSDLLKSALSLLENQHS